MESGTRVFSYITTYRVGPMRLQECNFPIIFSFSGGWGQGGLGLASLAAVQCQPASPSEPGTLRVKIEQVLSFNKEGT